MKITVKIKNVYGQEKVYPVCHTAQLLSALTGHLTFSPAMLHVIRELGYEISVETPRLEVA